MSENANPPAESVEELERQRQERDRERQEAATATQNSSAGSSTGTGESGSQTGTQGTQTGNTYRLTTEGSAPDFSPVLTQLQALPEMVANAVKEATQPPKHSETQTTEQTKEKERESTPGKKSFSQWWFGQ